MKMQKYTLNEIMRKNENFFSRESMKFFNSKINMNQQTQNNFNMFITSEKFDYNSPRLYTIRMFLKENYICTFSDFQQFETLSQAKKELKKLTNIFKDIENNECFLENEIINNLKYVDYKNDIYILEGKVENETKILKIDTDNKRWFY